MDSWSIFGGIERPETPLREQDVERPSSSPIAPEPILVASAPAYTFVAGNPKQREVCDGVHLITAQCTEGAYKLLDASVSESRRREEAEKFTKEIKENVNKKLQKLCKSVYYVTHVAFVQVEKEQGRILGSHMKSNQLAAFADFLIIGFAGDPVHIDCNSDAWWQTISEHNPCMSFRLHCDRDSPQVPFGQPARATVIKKCEQEIKRCIGPKKNYYGKGGLWEHDAPNQNAVKFIESNRKEGNAGDLKTLKTKRLDELVFASLRDFYKSCKLDLNNPPKDISYQVIGAARPRFDGSNRARLCFLWWQMGGNTCPYGPSPLKARGYAKVFNAQPVLEVGDEFSLDDIFQGAEVPEPEQVEPEQVEPEQVEPEQVQAEQVQAEQVQAGRGLTASSERVSVNFADMIGQQNFFRFITDCQSENAQIIERLNKRLKIHR